MSEYPEDVMKASIAARQSGFDNGAWFLEEPHINAIAAAIMTERQRCYDLVYWMALGEGSDFGLQAAIMNGDIPETPPPGYPGN